MAAENSSGWGRVVAQLALRIDDGKGMNTSLGMNPGVMYRASGLHRHERMLSFVYPFQRRHPLGARGAPPAPPFQPDGVREEAHLSSAGGEGEEKPRRA